MESFLVGSTVGDMVRAVAEPPALHRGCGCSRPCGVTRLAAGNAGHRVVESPAPAGFTVPDPAAAERHGIVFDAAVLANRIPPAACCRSRRCLPTSDACTWVVVDGAVHRARTGRRERSIPS